MSSRVEQDLAQLEKVAGGVEIDGAYLEYTVVRGDSLADIAGKFHTTVREIMLLNPIIVNVDLVRVGWVLKIPVKLK